MIAVPIVIGVVAVVAGTAFELHKRAKAKATATVATANAQTLAQPGATAPVVGPADPAQTAAQQAAAAAALAGGPTLGQQQMAQQASLTNQAAAGNVDATQLAQMVLDTPALMEGMSRAAGGLSIPELETIAASVGTSVQNMLAVSFIQNPGADPGNMAAVSASVAQTIAAMK